MEFFNSAIDVLQTLVIALGGGLCVWGGSTFWKATARITLRPNRRVSSSLSRAAASP